MLEKVYHNREENLAGGQPIYFMNNFKKFRRQKFAQ